MTARDLARAGALLDAGRPAEAETLLRPLLASDPHDAAVLRALAQAVGAQARSYEQSMLIRKAIALEPSNVSGYAILVDSLIDQGDFRAAVDAGSLAIQHGPNDYSAHYALGRAYIADKSHGREALAQADRAIELAPHSAGAHNLRGVAAVQLRRPDIAKDSYRQALRLDPTNAFALSNLAALERGRGRLGAAARTVRAGLAASPAHAPLHQNYDAILLMLILRLRWALLIFGLLLVGMSQSETPYGRRLVTLGVLVGICLGGIYWISRNLPTGAHLWAKGLFKRVTGPARFWLISFAVLSVTDIAIGVAPRQVSAGIGAVILAISKFIGLPLLIGYGLRRMARWARGLS